MPPTEPPGTSGRRNPSDSGLAALATARAKPEKRLSAPADPAQRPRLLIADDDPLLFKALANSMALFSAAIDVRFWQADRSEPPTQEPGLVEFLRQQIDAGWRPDVLVLDINLAHGGKSSIEYLTELRHEPGLAALAIVLATAQSKADLDENRMEDGQNNVTRLNPRDWLEKVKPFEPESILYGKKGSADFLVQVGESALAWRQIARRRAWQGLLDRVAEQLDGEVEVEAVGQTIVDYAERELAIPHAFVRWRKKDEYYDLVAWKTEKKNHVNEDDQVRVNDVPLLHELLDRQPVVLTGSQVTAELLGRYQAMAGHPCLGVGAMLEKRMVGFITLFRNPEQPPFDRQIDGRPLSILGRLLAAALGRNQSIARLRDRQEELLRFARNLAQAANREEVCEKLAEFLHKEVNDNDSANAKVTVRLIHFDSGMLRRLAWVGIDSESLSISIFDQCIYATTVRDNKTQRAEDARLRKDYRSSNPAMVAELCVPLAIGQRAIGAVNLEHTRKGKYKEHDEPFVESAAALAAQALARLKGGKFATDLLDFVERYAQQPREQSESRLREILHNFCGYSVLATMQPDDSNDLTKPWRTVGHIDLRLESITPETLRQELSDGERWADTWLLKLIKQKDWGRHAASFTENSNDFQHIPLVESTRNPNKPSFQRADAVLWLRRHDEPPHRALLLLWGLLPNLGPQDLAALEQFARLFSALEEREERVRGLVEQNILGEQAAAIGKVMQHFRHRLTNQSGAIAGYIDNLESALGRGELEQAKELLADLKGASGKLAVSFSKAQGYVKKVEACSCVLRDVVEQALADLTNRLADVDCIWELPPDVSCWTDPAIAQLIIYSLLENAADAMQAQESRQLRIVGRALDARQVLLRIEDNGGGILPRNRQRLFEFGISNKAGGLGSALAFARVRARLLGAELRHAESQPARGTAFELLLPADKDAFDAALTQLPEKRGEPQ